MEIDVIFKIATIGVLITLTIVIGMISDFFENIKSLFQLF